ncbi:MAG: chemotaxis protein CheW, partial [Spirochaetales bacterium]|nr:chemotaxis protein CheW [Spirochaetales bacterium]
MTENLPFSLSDDEADFEFEDHRKEQLDLLDFKMVTFTLGGKDYGIDIIKIKEISKANRFTYVPNAAPYVRGVYNLRGDIISIIDLRTMFNIPVVKKSQAAVSSLSIAGEEGGANEEMLILRLEHNTLGVIVDSIDKVVGASSKNIQPPHPIFGDINIQFIHGIVESDKRLYIILDVEKIFSQNVPEQESRPRPAVPAPGEAALSENSLEFTFTVDALAALGQFYVSALNQDWVKIRLTEWMKRRKLQGEDFQFKNSAEAEEFLRGFYSPGTGAFWNDDLINSLKALLPGTSAPGVNVWNIGCGAGFETYS